MQNEYHDFETSDKAEMSTWTDASAGSSRLGGAIVFILCLMLVFSAVAFGAVDAWAFGFLSLLTAAVAILWFAEGWRAKEFCFSTNPLQIPLLGLITIGLIQLLPLGGPDLPDGALSVSAAGSLSINPYATRLAVVQLIIFFVFLAASLTFVNSPQRMRRIVAVVIVFGAAMSFFGILQWLAGADGIYGLRPTPQAAPFASFVNRHHFAAFMEMTIGLALALLLGRGTKKDKQLLLLIAVVLMGLAIVFTGSRGGLLSLFGVLGFVFIASLSRKEKNGVEALEERRARLRRNLSLIGGGLALLVILFGSALLLGGESWLARGLGFTNQSDVSSGRMHFWSVALQIFRDYPMLGAGLDAFGTAFPRYDTWNGAYRVEQAHNDYLQILADAGILGFICIAAFIYLLVRQGLRIITAEQSRFRRSVAVGAMAGCFGVLLHSFFDFPLRTPSNAFFFLMFAVLATAPIVFPRNHHHKRR